MVHGCSRVLHSRIRNMLNLPSRADQTQCCMGLASYLWWPLASTGPSSTMAPSCPPCEQQEGNSLLPDVPPQAVRHGRHSWQAGPAYCRGAAVSHGPAQACPVFAEGRAAPHIERGARPLAVWVPQLRYAMVGGTLPGVIL